MSDKKLVEKLVNIPMARPGFDAFNMSAPIMMKINPDGKWQSCKPENLDEERLRSVVQHLVNSKTVDAAQNYCCQYAAESQKDGNGKSNYVPVIMMPIYSADNCLFDMDCELQKMKQTDSNPIKKQKVSEQETTREKDKEKKKTKKRGFVMQRLTDFDLLSQW